MTETPAEEPQVPEQDIAEALRDMLTQVLNENTSLEPHIVSDFIVIAEVHTGEAAYLRIVDSDLPPWRRAGLLAFTQQNDVAEAAGQTAWSLSIPGDDDES